MAKNEIPRSFLNDLDAYIEKNLPKVLEKYTTETLGDRSKYIGASDIAGCLRKSFLSKKEKVEHSIAKHIIFQRGHLTEQIVELMITGTNYKKQVELCSKTYNGFDIKAHLDFVIENNKRAVVLEVKSTSTPVDEPYESWILQIQLQMGLLQKRYPNKKISGYVVAMNVNTGWYKTFHVFPNITLYDMALKKANELAFSLQLDIEPKAELQNYCSECPFKDGCPAICSHVPVQLPHDLIKDIEEIGRHNNTIKRISSLKNKVMSFMKATNNKIVKANNTTISLVTKTNEYEMDIARFKIEEPELYSKYRKDSNTYSYLNII
jgi:CRISPR-associated exonuclease Cas4